MSAHAPYPAFALALVLGLAAGACDNTVEPFVEDDAPRYTVYGVLRTGADTQYVRVEPLRPTVAPEAGAALDAAVTTTHVETGAATAWRDSLVRLDDGTTGHLFFAAFAPEPGATYRLDVRRSDGRTTSAVARVPAQPRPVVLPPEQDTLGVWTQPLFWQGLGRVPEVDVRYDVVLVQTGDPYRLGVRYQQSGDLTPEGWLVRVRLQRDYFVLLDQLRLQADSTLTLHQITMEVESLGPEWDTADAGGNVEGGQGFFGSVARFTATWRPDDVVLRDLGFRVPAP